MLLPTVVAVVAEADAEVGLDVVTVSSELLVVAAGGTEPVTGLLTVTSVTVRGATGDATALAVVAAVAVAVTLALALVVALAEIGRAHV